jgi:hypothetical protein
MRTNLTLVRKSYDDMHIRILLARITLRVFPAPQTPPPV